MSRISFQRHRFPPPAILQAARWCFRFTLSIRAVEELMERKQQRFESRGLTSRGSLRPLSPMVPHTTPSTSNPT